MAPPRKTPAKRQRRGTKDATAESAPSVPIESETVKTPPAERGWLGATTSDWKDFWQSDLARFVRPTDRPVVKRLFRLRDQLVRAQRMAVDLRKKAMEDPVVAGSMGQQVANPLFKASDGATAEALALEPRVLALEDRLGLSPRARLALDVTEQQGMNLFGRNELLAQKMMEVASAPDPRAVEGDSATKTR